MCRIGRDEELFFVYFFIYDDVVLWMWFFFIGLLGMGIGWMERG